MKNCIQTSEKVDYDILDCDVLIRCICGNDIYMDYDEPVRCKVCDKIYQITMYVSSYEER